MRIVVVVLTVLALAPIACSSPPAPAGPPSAGSGDHIAEPGAETEEQSIRRAQLASCGPMCERLVDCSVDDLKKQKSAKEVSEMQLDELVPRAVADCNDKCSATTLSPRQVRVVQECVNGPEQCEDYLVCLDQATRGS